MMIIWLSDTTKDPLPWKEYPLVLSSCIALIPTRKSCFLIGQLDPTFFDDPSRHGLGLANHWNVDAYIENDHEPCCKR